MTKVMIDGSLNAKELALRSKCMGTTPLIFFQDATVQGTPLVWTVGDYNGAAIGHQYRWLDGRKPKTKTYLKVKPSRGGWYGTPGSKGTCVIVEDPMSALMVQHGLGTKGRVHCLFGTKLSADAESFMSHFDKVVVWLDPDKAGETASIEITKRLQFRYPVPTVTLYAPGYQPKDTPNMAIDIEEILRV